MDIWYYVCKKSRSNNGDVVEHWSHAVYFTGFENEYSCQVSLMLFSDLLRLK